MPANRTPLFKRDLYPEATVALDFVGSRGKPFYKAGGVTTNTFTSLPGLTITRATPSVAYAEDLSGNLIPFGPNTPRITNKGLLIEEARTNLLIVSQQFGSGSWVKTQSSVTDNAVNAPDGTLTADKIVENSATAIHYVAQVASVTASTSYTLSVYAKAGERTRVAVAGATGAWGSSSVAYFDLATGATLGMTGSGFTSQAITPVANGWYRLTVQATSQAAPAASEAFQVILVSTGTTTNYLGDGASGAYVWGAQIEAGSFPTSYIPTTASSTTRAADVVQIQLNSSMGTAWSAAGRGYHNNAISAGFPRPFSLDNNSTSAFFLYRGSSGTTLNQRIDDGGVTQTDQTIGQSGLTTGLHAWAVRFQANSMAGMVDASGVTTDTTASMPTSPTLLRIGSGNAINYWNDYIERLVLYPRALSDGELANLTLPNDNSSLSLNFASGTYATRTPYVRTNNLANSAGAGASAPTTLPTGWAWSWNGGGTGLTREVVGTGTEDGMPYVDFRVAGTVALANEALLVSQSATASVGQTWAASGYVKLISGTAPAVTRLFIVESPTGGGFSTGSDAISVNTTSPTKAFVTRTLADAVTNAILHRWRIDVTQGATYDFTIRLYAGQAEQAAYPSSYILTSGSTASVLTTQSTNLADIGNLTCTRNLAAYAEDNSGNLTLFPANVPRITNKGLLVEEARTNLLLRSQEFDNASWSTTDVTITPNATTAPDGTLTADLVTSSTATGTAQVRQQVALTNATAYAFAIYTKQGTSTQTSLRIINAASSAVARIDLTWSSGVPTVGTTTGTTSAAATAVVDGWYRISGVYTAAATETHTLRYFTDQTSSNGTMYVWQADVQAGSFITSPIPTTTASVARPADVIYISSLTLSTPLTVGVQAITPQTQIATWSPSIAAISDGTNNNTIRALLSSGAGGPRGIVTVGGVSQADISHGAVSVNTSIMEALRADANNVGFSSNGSAATLDTSATMPTGLTTLTIGQRAPVPGTTDYWSGYIQRALVYPYAANDAELQYRSGGSF